MKTVKVDPSLIDFLQGNFADSPAFAGVVVVLSIIAAWAFASAGPR